MELVIATMKRRWLKSARKATHLRARPLTAFDRKTKSALGAAAWGLFSRSWEADKRHLLGEFVPPGGRRLGG